ncbi:MAG: flagellar protein FlgN [Smithellaceae bacterium]
MLEQITNLASSREENSCENIFVSLIEILRKELTVYQELKSTIIGEKKVLLKPTLNELNHTNALKENIILKARMLEEARRNILKKIARNLDVNTNDIKINQLAGYAGHEQRKEIEKISNDLALIARDINILNDANKKLLDTSLTCVQSSLDFISSIMFQGAVYMGSGKIKTMQNNGRFLHTEG